MACLNAATPSLLPKLALSSNPDQKSSLKYPESSVAVFAMKYWKLRFSVLVPGILKGIMEGPLNADDCGEALRAGEYRMGSEDGYPSHFLPVDVQRLQNGFSSSHLIFLIL
jgi:hypothetical protein